MAPAPDYYATLGVSASASPHQIREAYKRAALKTHPDRVSHSDPTRPARTRRFQQVNDAYYVLSDSARRAAYDATHSSTSSPTEDQFGDVFEEMMRDEGLDGGGGGGGAGGGSLWSMLGGVSGATIGFIVGNFPGMLAGAVAGNRLGAVRDRKGKSVYDVFRELPQGEREKLLAALAAKVMAHVVSL